MTTRWLNRRYPEYKNTSPARQPGAVSSWKPHERGLNVTFRNDIQLEIRFLAPHMVRITWTPGSLPQPYAVASSFRDDPDLHVKHDKQSKQASSSLLSVQVREDGALVFFNADDQVLRIEDPPILTGEQWQHTFHRNDGEVFFGLGEQSQTQPLADGKYPLWNTDPSGNYGYGDTPLYMPLPVLHSAGKNQPSYLIFYENHHKGEVQLGASCSAHFQGGALRYYLVPGSPRESLPRYTQLTGRPGMPPRWALGFHQCRWGYKNEQEIREIANGFLQHQLPISSIHLDIDYMDGYRVFTVDKQRFPDLKKLAADMEKQGIKLVTILDPGIKEDERYPLYQDGLKQDIFCKSPGGEVVRALVWPGWTVLPDFTKPRARAWWGKHYDSLLEQGIAGFWHDMNEPATFTAWGEGTLPRCTRHDLDGQGGDHTASHNLYGFQMNRAGYEALENHPQVQRPWLLSRSGWAGLQRYAWHWTGDVDSTWDALKATVGALQGLSLSGIYYSGSDVGGFTGTASDELFVRWFQMASFTPFFRNHIAKATPNEEPWQFGKKVLQICRRYLNLRYRLLPYLYTLAWDVHQNGLPFIRPLFFDAPEQEDLYQYCDSFMVGESILAAPIFEPRAVQRTVHLPPGTWYDFWTDEVYESTHPVHMPVTLDDIPVFIRGGTILPMENGGALALHLYPEAGSSETAGHAVGRLYMDAGDGYDAYRRTIFTLKPTETGGYTLTHEHEGTYPFPYRHVTLHLHHMDSAAVRIGALTLHPINHTVKLAREVFLSGVPITLAIR